MELITIKGEKGDKKMSISMIVVVALYILLSVGGLVIFKLGSAKELSFGLTNGSLHLQMNLLVILGLLLYAISFLLYMFAVSKLDLSYITPICTGSVYILTFIAAKVVFDEQITSFHYVGALLILCGVLLINFKKS